LWAPFEPNFQRQRNSLKDDEPMQKEDLIAAPEEPRQPDGVKVPVWERGSAAHNQRVWDFAQRVLREPTPLDPKTKYLRRTYPVDGQVHTDANGNQYILIDVYTVLQAFTVSSHALGHAIKKLLCAGIRGKGGKVQDLEESKIAIDRGIQEAKLEGAK
jgi:hypothetical protein